MGNSIKYIILGIMSFLGQMLISEYVNIWTMLYIAIFPAFLMIIPMSLNVTLYMLLAFLFGLGIDSFSDGVIGLNAAACVAIAYLRKPLLSLILTKNSIENIDSISIKELGVSKFIVINLLLYSVFFLIYLSLDNFWSVAFLFTLLKFIINIIINVIFAIVIEYTLVSKFSINYRG